MQNHVFELKKNTEKSMISKIKANVWGQIQTSGTYNLYARGFRYINTMPFENHLDINSLKLGDCANHIRSITWLLCDLPFSFFSMVTPIILSTLSLHKNQPTHLSALLSPTFSRFSMKEKARMNEWMKERKKAYAVWLMNRWGSYLMHK